MRVLVVYCHPVETSFHAALHQVRAARSDGCGELEEVIEEALVAVRRVKTAMGQPWDSVLF